MAQRFKQLRHPHYVLFVAILVVSGPLLTLFMPLYESLLLGFDLAVTGFVLRCASLWRGGTADVLRKEAASDDAGRVLLVLLSVLIALIVLVALGMLVLARTQMGPEIVALVIASLLACWLFVNLIFAFHYARMYFDAGPTGDREGLAFPGPDIPDFADFVNFAFVIGMTCQTADIAITAPRIRRIATLHGMFAFVFNLGILALCVNVVASGTAG